MCDISSGHEINLSTSDTSSGHVTLPRCRSLPFVTPRLGLKEIALEIRHRLFLRGHFHFRLRQNVLLVFIPKKNVFRRLSAIRNLVPEDLGVPLAAVVLSPSFLSSAPLTPPRQLLFVCKLLFPTRQLALAAQLFLLAPALALLSALFPPPLPVAFLSPTVFAVSSPVFCLFAVVLLAEFR